jgi:hypothetical protein
LAQGVFRVEWDPQRQQEVVRTFQDLAHARTSGALSFAQQRASSLSATRVTVETFVQRIHEQLRIHHQEGPRSTGHVGPNALHTPAGATP